MEATKNYRKANGRRVEGRGLAIRISQDVKGMLLAQAFVVAKSAGFYLLVNKLDGVPHKAVPLYDRDTINVEVINGVVKKSWVS